MPATTTLRTRAMPRQDSARAWPIRAVQLDLARHLETVDYVRRYADFAAAHGFNTLVLYLEGRVRTDTFPYRPVAESYTLTEMARVVKHAQGNGLDVVPAVSTLAHCEQFLACPKLGRLAELRDGVRGRFGNAGPGHVVCPSLAETYAFFDTYLRELADVFTGPHLHIGLDEVWDLGFCPLCRARVADAGPGGLFAEHLLRLNDILTSLGKRTWLWDDMYEFFPRELERVPKTAVLCHWQYDDAIAPEGIQAHFANRRRQDWLAKYEQLGIESLICPWAISLRNVESFTAYARRYRVLGGLLTQWEGTPRFQPTSALAVAYCGRRWRGPTAPRAVTWAEAVAAVVPELAEPAAEAVAALTRVVHPHLATNLAGYQAGPLAGEEVLQRDLTRVALAALTADPGAAVRLLRGPGVETVDDLLAGARTDLLYWELRELVPAICSPRRPRAEVPDLRARLAAAETEWTALRDWRERHYTTRPDRHPTDQPLAAWTQLKEQLLDVLAVRLGTEPTAQDWLLILRLFLQDFYGAPFLEVTIATEREPVLLAGVPCKPSASVVRNRTGGHFEIRLGCQLAATPERVRLESWGYGGLGVCSLELQNRSLRYGPAAVCQVRGQVLRPEAVLDDDSACAWFGQGDIRAAMLEPALAEQRHCLELTLAPL